MDSNPNHNAHVETIEITYPYHPQCGAGVVVHRRRKRGGQEMYDTIDVHGGSAGVPVWMTEPRWRNLRVVERAILPVEALRELRELLLSQKSCLNAGKPLHGEQRNDEQETASSSAQTEDKHEASE